MSSAGCKVSRSGLPAFSRPMDFAVESLHRQLDLLEKSRKPGSSWNGVPYDLLLVNCRLATMDPSIDASYGEISSAAVGIVDGTFVYVGKEAELPRGAKQAAKHLCDLGGRWVPPSPR